MLWIDFITIVNLLRGVVEEQLSVAEDPVAECEKEEWALGKKLKGPEVEATSVTWGLSVQISKLQPLRHIQVEHAEGADGEQKRQGYPVGECCEHHQENVGVLEVKFDLRARMNVDELLHCRALSCWNEVVNCGARVLSLFDPAHREEYQSFYPWKQRFDQHGLVDR